MRTDLVATGIVTCCCDLHRRDGCCDPVDCGPCCPECPTCPTLIDMTTAARKILRHAMECASVMAWVEMLHGHAAAQTVLKLWPTASILVDPPRPKLSILSHLKESPCPGR